MAHLRLGPNPAGVGFLVWQRDRPQLDGDNSPLGDIPAEFEVEGFFFRYARHFMYWRRLTNGDIGIFTILHERMHQIDRLRDNFES